MTDSCCLHFHYLLDLTFLFVTFSEEEKKHTESKELSQQP